MTKSAGAVHEAISALAALDVDGLSDDELDALARSLQRARHRLAGVTATVLARWDARGVWSDDGSRSAAARLARDGATSVATANVDLRRARKLTSMPHVHAAVRAGTLSMDHVDLLGRAAQPGRAAAFAEHEAMLVGECSKLRFAHARRLVDYWCQRVDAHGCAEEAAREVDAASFHASTTIDGTVVLGGRLDRVGGAVFTGELHRLERELFLADQRAGIVRAPAQRRAAALIEMAARSAAAGDGRRPRPLFTVLVGADSFRHLCELADGRVVSPSQIVGHLDDADIESVLFDGPTTVVAVSQRRTFVGAVRRAVEVRDRHCQHPSGCDVPASECDVDHVVPHRLGGLTSQFSGRLECRPHNRDHAKHDHGARPLPARPIDRLDELRCRIRYRVQRAETREAADADAADADVAADTAEAGVALADVAANTVHADVARDAVGRK